MFDAQPHFGVDENVALQQQIKMLAHRAGKRIFDWDHGGRGAA
jgi:hypothetical protein